MGNMDNPELKKYLKQLKSTAKKTGQKYQDLVSLNQDFIDEEFNGRPGGDVKNSDYRKRMAQRKNSEDKNNERF